MPLFNKVSFSKEDLIEINSYYREGKNHDLRQKAHLLILRSIGFPISTLMIILNRDRQFIKLIIKGWFYLRYDCFKNLSRKALKSQIQEARRKRFLFWRSVFNLKNIIRKFFIILGKFLQWIFRHLLFLIKGIWTLFSVPIIWVWSIIFKIFLKFLSIIKAIDFKKYYLNNRQKISNRIEIGKQSSHNFIIQIVTNFQDGVNYSKDNIEKIAASTFSELKQQIYKILDTGKSFTSNDLLVAFTFALNERVQQVKSKEFRKRLLYILATIITCYIVFNATLKPGLVLITILGLTFTLVDIRGCSREIYFKQKDHFSSFFNNTNNAAAPDSVLDKKFIEPVLPIFIPDEECGNLSKLDRKYIDQDTTNYYNKKYFIKIPDNRFYLHVAAYHDIREAAFQREFLIHIGYPNSKILEKYDWRTHLYLVTIADFLPEQIYRICTSKDSWDMLCNKIDSKAQVVFNNY